MPWSQQVLLALLSKYIQHPPTAGTVLLPVTHPQGYVIASGIPTLCPLCFTLSRAAGKSLVECGSKHPLWSLPVSLKDLRGWPSAICPMTPLTSAPATPWPSPLSVFLTSLILWGHCPYALVPTHPLQVSPCHLPSNITSLFKYHLLRHYSF